MSLHAQSDCISTVHVPAKSGPGAAFAGVLGWWETIVETSRKRMAARAALRRFQNMSDRELDDIGLSRIDILDALNEDRSRDALDLLQLRRHNRIYHR